MIAAAALLTLALAASPAAHHSPRWNYLEQCGGCHGMDGRAASSLTPDLAGRAGWFLCTGSGRAYIARLPNVALARLSDEDLAALLNYVDFDLGRASAPPRARRYTAREVSDLRSRPLGPADLKAYRARVVTGLVTGCGAPDRLLTDYTGALAPKAETP